MNQYLKNEIKHYSKAGIVDLRKFVEPVDVCTAFLLFFSTFHILMEEEARVCFEIDKIILGDIYF